MARRPRRRLADRCLDGEESRKVGKEAKVANREEDDWGRKMWRWVRESEIREEISCSGNVKAEVEHIEEI